MELKIWEMWRIWTLVLSGTALRNQLRIVSEGMSSWTALTMYLGMNTTFYTKYIKANVFGLLS